MSDVTQMFLAIDQGDPQAASLLLPLVYDELRKLAAAKLAHETPGQTLDATGLVHEAYLRLAGPERGQHWDGRRHFFAAAAEAMRRILVERARRERRLKRGGQLTQHDLDSAQTTVPTVGDDILAVDAALTKLAAADPQAAELVQLR
jgi:RNA polymerase sigma factor (TIGR02999 family)